MLFPLHGTGAAVEEFGSDTSNSNGTTVTAGGSANTKGSWAQIAAATSFDAAGIMVQTMEPDATGRYLLDVGIGAASSEEVIIANIPYWTPTNQNKPIGPMKIFFPLAIPEGVRLSARVQSSGASNTLETIFTLVSQTLGPGPYSRCTTYGADTTNTDGTAVDPGAVANTKTIVEIDGSTANPMSAVIFVSGDDNAAMGNHTFLWELAIGAASSEIVIVPNLNMEQSSIEHMTTMPTLAWPLDIPASTRVSINAQSSSTDANDRVAHCIIFGLD